MTPLDVIFVKRLKIALGYLEKGKTGFPNFFGYVKHIIQQRDAYTKDLEDGIDPKDYRNLEGPDGDWDKEAERKWNAGAKGEAPTSVDF